MEAMAVPGSGGRVTRSDLVDCLRRLADGEYQRRVWVERRYPPGAPPDNLDRAIDLLMIHTSLADDPGATMGWLLFDETEARLVADVISAIDDVLDAVGTESPDEDYLLAPEWAAVLAAARTAYVAMAGRSG